MGSLGNCFLKLLSISMITLFLFSPSAGQAKIIQAEIEHKEILPEVPAPFRTGAVLDHQSIQPRVEWFPVPDWMAGTWMKEGDMETYEKDFLRNSEIRLDKWVANQVTIFFGHLKDAKNTIWHAEVTPFRADGKRGMSRDQRYVMQISCLNSSPSNVVLSFHSVVVGLDSRGVVAQSRQQEEIIRFYPDSASTMTTVSSTKTFDEKGRPLYQLNSHTKRLKMREFEERTSQSGIDLVTSLNDFFSQNNMQDRIATCEPSEDRY